MLEICNNLRWTNQNKFNISNIPFHTWRTEAHEEAETRQEFTTAGEGQVGDANAKIQSLQAEKDSILEDMNELGNNIRELGVTCQEREKESEEISTKLVEERAECLADSNYDVVFEFLHFLSKKILITCKN